MNYYIFSYSWSKYDNTTGNQCVTISNEHKINCAEATVSVAKNFKYRAVIPYLFQEIDESGFHEHNSQFGSQG